MKRLLLLAILALLLLTGCSAPDIDAGGIKITLQHPSSHIRGIPCEIISYSGKLVVELPPDSFIHVLKDGAFSMTQTFGPGATLIFSPVDQVYIGDIVLVPAGPNHYLVHRVLGINWKGTVTTRGDAFAFMPITQGTEHTDIKDIEWVLVAIIFGHRGAA